MDGKPLLEKENPSDLSILGRACFWYLEKVSLELKDLSCSPSNLTLPELELFAQTVNDYPLLVYALEHVADHVSSDQKVQVVKLERTLTKLSENPIRFLLPDWMPRQTKLRKSPRRPKIDAEDYSAFKNGILHCAADKGFSIAVKMALIAGADVESRSTLHESGENAMCLAISKSNDKREQASLSIVRTLLEHGADPNAITRQKGTPLHYAGKYMRESIMELLLERGAKVNAKDSLDMTPLHRTIIGMSHEDLLWELQDEHPPSMPNMPSTGQPSASGEPNGSHGANNNSHRLAREASLRCVEILLKAGADLQAGDIRGRKPIHWAARLHERPEFVTMLVKARSKRKKNWRAINEVCTVRGTVPLHWASGYGNKDVVDFLINEGADIEWADRRGKTAVIWAAGFGRTEILQCLLDGLKDPKRIKNVVNMKEKGGRTALIWASKEGHMECVKLLIKAGADVNHCEGGEDDTGGTPLSWAVTSGHDKISQLLLNKGARLDSSNDHKRPLLGWAACSGSIDMFRMLRKSAEYQRLLLRPDETDMNGCTPFMLAAARGHIEMMEYLYSLRESENARINVHYYDHDRNTALLLAAGWGMVDAVQWLVETAGLDINHQNRYRSTALHRAAYWGRHQVISYLLSRGAREDLRDGKGRIYTELSDEYHQQNQGV